MLSKTKMSQIAHLVDEKANKCKNVNWMHHNICWKGLVSCQNKKANSAREAIGVV